MCAGLPGGSASEAGPQELPEHQPGELPGELPGQLLGEDPRIAEQASAGAAPADLLPAPPPGGGELEEDGRPGAAVAEAGGGQDGEDFAAMMAMLGVGDEADAAAAADTVAGGVAEPDLAGFRRRRRRRGRNGHLVEGSETSEPLAAADVPLADPRPQPPGAVAGPSRVSTPAEGSAEGVVAAATAPRPQPPGEMAAAQAVAVTGGLPGSSAAAEPAVRPQALGLASLMAGLSGVNAPMAGGYSRQLDGYMCPITQV